MRTRFRTLTAVILVVGGAAAWTPALLPNLNSAGADWPPSRPGVQ